MQQIATMVEGTLQLCLCPTALQENAAISIALSLQPPGHQPFK
jgi:hypothetical protein